MDITELQVRGSYLVTPTIHSDDRGAFAEWYRHDALEAVVGHPLRLAQANWSTSRRGVVRGVHYADVPPGQAKYVTCVRGEVLDVVVDLRTGSPDFGGHDAVTLSAGDRRAVYLPEGLGHAFCALTDDATVLYLCSTTYDPAVDRNVHPLDPELALPWPVTLVPQLSPKDATAPTLAQARQLGTLPALGDCHQRVLDLAAGAGVAR